MSLIDWSRLDGPGVVGNFLVHRVMPCQRRVHSAYEYAGSQDPTGMHRDGLEKPEVQQLMNELFNRTDDNFVRSDDRMHAFKLGRPAPMVNEYLCLFVQLHGYYSLLADDLSFVLLQIGDIDRCSVYVSLAPGTHRRAVLLGVLDTPAVKKNRTAPHRPLKIGWRGRGRWLWSHPKWKQCRRRPARPQSVADL